MAPMARPTIMASSNKITSAIIRFSIFPCSSYPSLILGFQALLAAYDARIPFGRGGLMEKFWLGSGILVKKPQKRAIIMERLQRPSCRPLSDGFLLDSPGPCRGGAGPLGETGL
jgi:hypothetical protein